MKSILLAFAFMTIATFSFAQDRNDLKGPAAKNYKPWQKSDNTTPKKVYTVDTSDKLQGPSAKNEKAWKGEKQNFQQIELVSNKPRTTGPKAKNAKPWNN